MQMKYESDIYVPTPMCVLGPGRYADLERHARKVLTAKGWDGKGIPALVFDGAGGVFVAVEVGAP